MLDQAAIPAELRERPQWVCWSYEERTAKSGERKTTKVLKRTGGGNADSTDPASWTTFENATAAADRFDGIGYVFSKDDPYTGVDFDQVIDASGEFHPVAEEMVTGLDSYAEWSPSRTGVHVVVNATKNGFPRSNTGKTPWGGKFEVYDWGRFFTFTGRRLNGRGVEQRQRQLERLLAQIWPNEDKHKPEATGTTDARARAPKPDPDVLERWQDQAWFGRLQQKTSADQSDVDFAVACSAVEHGADFDELCKLLSAARTTRCPGDDKAVRDDYLVRTANRALAKTSAKDDAKKLTGLLGLDKVKLHVIGVETFGNGSMARIDVALSDGRTVVFERASDMGNTSRLATEIAISTGARISPSREDAIEALSLVHNLADAQAGAMLDADACDWGREFLERARTRQTDMGDQADRWRAFCELTANNPVTDARAVDGNIADHALVLADGAGARYVTVGTFWEFCRRQNISPSSLKTQMLSVGWKRRGERGAITARQPKGAGKIVRSFYLVPPGWEGEE